MQSARERDFSRMLLRSSFQSLFWAVILNRKRKTGLTLTELARKLGVNKSYISRSFSSPPNWQIDKISDLADVLGVEVILTARDLATGEHFTPTGKIHFASTTSEDGQIKIGGVSGNIGGIASSKSEIMVSSA